MSALSPSTSTSSAVVTYTFPDSPLCGRVIDESGNTVYQMYVEEGILGTKSSTVSRRDSEGNFEPFVEINWESLLRRPESDRKDTTLPCDIVEIEEWWFVAGDGAWYFWRGLDCFNSKGTWVASYLRRIARVRQSESPATLSLDVNYSTSVILDSILASALVMEKKREDAEEHRCRRGLLPRFSER